MIEQSQEDSEKELLEDIDFLYSIYRSSLVSGKSNVTSLNTLIRALKAVHRYYINDENPIRLTYEERIRWFINNYYESGMEYSLLLETMRSEDLDNFTWYDEIIRIPKYQHELPQK